MQISEMNLEEIEARLAEINSEIETRSGEELETLKTEVAELQERKAELVEMETRKAQAQALNEGAVQPDKIIEKTVRMEDKTMDQKELFLRSLQGTLTPEMRSAIDTTGAAAVIPVELQNDIIAKVHDYAPVLGDITLLHAGNYVKFAVEGVVADAADHTENATIAGDADTMVSVELTTTEIVKMIQISDSAKTMSLPNFEAFVIDTIGQKLAEAIEAKVFAEMKANGTKAITGAVTAANVYALFAALKSGYARNAKVYANRTTLFTMLLPLEDDSKNKLVVYDGNGIYRVLGVEVEETPSLASGVVMIADPKKFVANIAENIGVKSAFDIDTNSYKYLGVAQYAGKVALAEAFQYIAPTEG